MPKGCKRCGVMLPDTDEAGIAVCKHCGTENGPKPRALLDRIVDGEWTPGPNVVNFARVVMALLVPICLIVAAANMGQERISLLGYTALGIAAAIVAWWLIAWIPWASQTANRRFWAAFAIAILAMRGGCRLETFDEEGLTVRHDRCVTTYRRWDEAPVCREVHHKAEADWDHDWYFHGPLTPSDKPHGKWHKFHVSAKHPSTDHWFWYGEEVTEGEFELRSK